MTGDRFRADMDIVVAAVRTFDQLVSLVNVGELLATVQRAETLGPILDPTRYVQGGGNNLCDQADLLRAVGRLHAVVERLREQSGVRGVPPDA